MSALEDVLANAIQKATGGIENAVDFALEQAPDIVQQAMLWYSVKSFLLLLLSMGCVFLIVRCRNSIKDPDDDEFVVFKLICIVVLSASWLVLFFSGFDWLKIWIAPKLWLVEFAAGMTK